VRRVLDIELFLQAPTRLKQPVSPVLGDRTALALALGLQRAAPFTNPATTALRAGDELAGIKLDRRRLLVVRRRLGDVVTFAGKALLRDDVE
jgi:hypothetical protein